jgi:hypothetical protein
MNSIELRLGDNRAGKVPALVGMSILQSVNGMFTDLKMRLNFSLILRNDLGGVE